MRSRGAFSLILATLCLGPGCRKERPSPPPPVQTPAVAPAPWEWHRLGGLLVVTGEPQEAMDLVIRGRYMNSRIHAEPGPLRWELYAPPKGEVAELRTEGGELLARWTFDPVGTAPLPPPSPEPVAVARAPVPPKPAPPATRPTQPTPAANKVPVQIAKPAPPERSRPERAESTRPAPLRPKPAPETSDLPTPPVQVAARPTPVAPIPSIPVPDPITRPPRLEPIPLPRTDPSPTGNWPGAGEGFNLLRGPRGSHWVCITFDGGSTAEVALDVLDALRDRNIRTTFFLTGAFIQKHPSLVLRMNRDGHEIGNHTLDHPHFAPGMKRDPQWTKERVQQQLLQADEAFFRLVGRPMDPYWRAPYGESTPEIRRWVEELGYRHIGWSEGADTLDWATVNERKLYRTGNAILDRLYKRMQKHDGDGLIVLMHLGSGRPESDRPARILGPFLDQALDEGWNFVNVGTYLKESGRPHWNPAHRLAMLTRPVAHR